MQANTTVEQHQNNQLVKHWMQVQKPLSGTPHMIRQSILWMRVNIRTQLVWRNLPINRFTRLDYMALWDTVNRYIQPIPNMRLFNWFFICRQSVCKVLLFTTQQLNYFFEFFFHIADHFTSVLVFKSTSLIV